MFLLQILLAIFFVVLSRTLWKRWKYDLHKIPSPPGLPLLRHMLEVGKFTKNPSQWLCTKHIKLGHPKLMKIQFFAKTWIFVMDINCMRSEINNKTNPLPKHPIIKAFSKPLLSNQNVKDTLGITNNKTYAQQIRKAYSAGLQTSQLRKCFPKLKEVMNHMIEIIEKTRQKGPIDFQDLCVAVTLDAIGAAAFERTLGGLEGSRIPKGIRDASRRGRVLMHNPLLGLYNKFFPNSNFARETREMTDILKDEWDNLTREIMARPDPPEGETPIWYNIKTVVEPDTNERLPYETLRSEVATIVLTGMDTTGHQLSWILGMLAAHPNIVNEILDELKEHQLYGPNSRDVEFEDLTSLPYLNAVIKEGFRVVTVVPGGFPRFLPRDMTLLGYRLPKGTMVNYPGNRALNTVKEWGDPDVVRPERWLAGEDMSSKYFHMFSFGPRDCVGQKLAMLEIRLAIVTILSKYRLSTDKSFGDILENAINTGLIESKGGMWLEVSPRE